MKTSHPRHGEYMVNKELNLLEEIRLFRGLTRSELDEVRERIAIKRFKKNETILREEDTNKYMYVILKGRVRAVQATEEGKEIVLGMHSTGEMFGEISLIDKNTVPASVIAATDSLVATISREVFVEWLHSRPKILDNLLDMLCRRFREGMERIRMLNMNNASQRIQMLFMRLIRDYGERQNEGYLLKIKLTHNEIANMTGLTRETVTRIIKRWKSEGMLLMKGGAFVVRDALVDT